MSRAPYVNLDAEWLATLGDTFIEDGDFDTGLRLSKIAERLQSLDDRYASLTGTNDLYHAGVIEGLRRAYERSNLPPEERTPTQAMREAGLGPAPEPRRIPAGMTGARARAVEKRKADLARRAPNVSKLSGIKLNLSSLFEKEQVNE